MPPWCVGDTLEYDRCATDVAEALALTAFYQAYALHRLAVALARTQYTGEDVVTVSRRSPILLQV